MRHQEHTYRRESELTWPAATLVISSASLAMWAGLVRLGLQLLA